MRPADVAGEAFGVGLNNPHVMHVLEKNRANLVYERSSVITVQKPLPVLLTRTPSFRLSPSLSNEEKCKN